MSKKSAKKGMKISGPPHSRGGVKTVNKTTKEVIEVEGGEVVINKEAAAIHCEKLSEINQSAGNGVPIPCAHEHKTCTCSHEETMEKGGIFSKGEPSKDYVTWAEKQLDSNLLFWAGYASKKEYEQINEKDFNRAEFIHDFATELEPVYQAQTETELAVMERGGKIREVCGVGTEIQTILFDKKRFSLGNAKKWLTDHNFKHGFADVKENTYRFRQQEPDEFKEDSFRTIELTTGIKAVIGCPKEKE